MVKHAARLDPRVLFLRLDLDDPVQILGEIDDDGDIARLSAEAGAAAARQQRRAMLAGERDGLNHFVDGAGNNDADGYLAVVGAVDGIESAGGSVKADVAGDGGAQLCGESVGAGAGEILLLRA